MQEQIEQEEKFYSLERGLDDADAVGHVQGVEVLGQPHVGLLQPVRPHQRVHLGALDLVQLAHGLLDLALVGGDVHNEDEGVVVLNLLHGGLSGQWVLDGAVLVHLLGLQRVW
eukprot:CAMPEP_0194566752 /NCGR_PEP_ID=MMETSP0292-20121207/5503_1 /TAXON_ID=39354 /ORGANISM="Heterosigma akashiwo, Strain CCMP2393" /LENGTH=112 /DNA_ID=CAMNT_0039416387 /DNA_START=783 /DNA_END=1118 /DNA_ORIENTATION=-